MSYIDDYSDKKVRALEHRLAQLYKKAHKELKQKAEGYFDNFAERYEKEYEAYQKGKYSKIEWQLWQKAQFGRGARWEKLTTDMARKLKDTNKEAAKWVNDQVPTMFSENANFTAFEIEKTTMKDMGIAFNIYNEDAVKRLMLEEPDLFPKNLKINEKKDVVWNKKKLNNALTSAIVQGKTLKELADSFQHVTDMNRNSAIRNARTAMTGAQNGGRQKTFNDAVDMGIELQKEWITAGDARVRDSHAALDGVTVGNEETFPNGLRFPADPNGSPSEVYNCRCTMQAYMPKYNQKRTENTVESYNEWKYDKENNVTEYNDLKDKYGLNVPDTLEKYNKLKNSDDYTAYKIFLRDIDKGEIEALVGYEEYLKMYHRTKDELIGLTTSNGIEIKDVSIHLTTRIFGHMWHENNPKVRRGVTIVEIKETLRNEDTKIGTEKKNKYGSTQSFCFGSVETRINVDTRKVVQANPNDKNSRKR